MIINKDQIEPVTLKNANDFTDVNITNNAALAYDAATNSFNSIVPETTNNVEYLTGIYRYRYGISYYEYYATSTNKLIRAEYENISSPITYGFMFLKTGTYIIEYTTNVSINSYSISLQWYHSYYGTKTIPFVNNIAHIKFDTTEHDTISSVSPLMILQVNLGQGNPSSAANTWINTSKVWLTYYNTDNHVTQV